MQTTGIRNGLKSAEHAIGNNRAMRALKAGKHTYMDTVFHPVSNFKAHKIRTPLILASAPLGAGLALAACGGQDVRPRNTDAISGALVNKFGKNGHLDIQRDGES